MNKPYMNELYHSDKSRKGCTEWFNKYSWQKFMIAIRNWLILEKDIENQLEQYD